MIGVLREFVAVGPASELGWTIRASRELVGLPVVAGVFPLVLEKIRGHKRMSGDRSWGRQAQIIPELASMVVQMVDHKVPYDGSLDLEDLSSVVARRIDVIQTLVIC